MKQKRTWVIALVVVVVIALGLAFRNGSGGNEPTDDATPFKEVTVTKGEFRSVVSATGEVKPIDRVEIKSKASGTIETLAVEQGVLVSRGDLIAQLDQRDERALFEQTQADLDIATAELKQAELQFSRRQKLFERGLLSEEELGEIELNLAIAKGKLIQARTALDRAEERLAEAIVRAPISGVILQKYVEEGQIIASGVSNVGGGTPIVDIADMSKVHVQAGIDEIDIGKISPGQVAEVIADAYPNRQFRGTITRISPEARVDQNVTLFDVIVEVENIDGLLKSGMNSNVEITIAQKSDILLLPTTALRKPREGRGGGNKRIALVKQGDGFKPRPVEIGVSNFKESEIISGLDEGDVVGIPIVSRLEQDNERLQERIRGSRSFGAPSSGNRQSSSRR